MRCPQCQHDTPGTARFCEECGSRLARRCASCNAELSAAAKFCPECGNPAGEPPAPGPSHDVPTHAGEQILTSRTALEGERKQVTVLFADLKGSMELLADRDPEEARRLLDPVIARMVEAVHRYAGIVNQVMGDGIMALFGAPLGQEDHAVRACYAALRMQQAIRQYALETRKQAAMPVQIRVGLNSGEVVVGAIGSDLRMEYTAVGQTTHLASRMEQSAPAGCILMTANTHRLVEGYVEVIPLAPLELKGLSAPVAAYELIATGPARTRLEAAAPRGFTRFVGRDLEMGQLRQALGQARQGRGQFVTVVGEAGVGKSRLFWQFVHGPWIQGSLVLATSGRPLGHAPAYGPVTALLRTYFHVGARDDAGAIRERIRARLVALDEALVPTLPAFLSLLDVPTGDPRWQELEPAQRHQRTIEAIKRLLLRQSQVHPLVVLVEDLQWVDAETETVLASMVDGVPAARMLLLVSYRPEYEHSWGARTYYTRMRIDALPADSSEELLRAMLGDEPSLAPLDRLLIQQTEGNPFFLEESIRDLVETRVLVGESGRYRLATPIDAIRIPPTVQAILAARIDRLAPEDKSLLQTAAVIGKDVPLAQLQTMVELSEEALRQGISRLQAAEFLHEMSPGPELEYTFRHALTHGVAYGSLLQERRRTLHARVVGAIERLHADGLTEHVEALAHHAVQGERWDKAVTYLRQAGHKAALRAANHQAVASLEQALVAQRRLPESRERRAEELELRLDLRNALLSLGSYDEILQHLEAAESLANALDDRLRLAQVLGYKSHWFAVTGQLLRGIEPAREALAIATELNAFSLQIETMWRLAALHFSLSEFDRAIEASRQCLEGLAGDPGHAHRTGPTLTAVLARVWLARALAERGEFAEARALAEESLRIAESVGHTSSLTIALWGVGVVALIKGDLEAAHAALERGLAICQGADLAMLYPAVASNLGMAFALGGKPLRAVELLEQGVSQGHRSFDLALCYGFLAETYLGLGSIAEALRFAEQSREVSEQRHERAYHARALRVLGAIHAHPDVGDTVKAEAYFRRALADGEALGMRPFVAHCHLGLGRLHARRDEREAARRHLDLAAAMFQAMGMAQPPSSA